MPPVVDELYIACPKCGGGLAYATFADENGTNRKCQNCGHGFTQPTSADTLEGGVTVPEAIASERTTGQVLAGSVLPSGEAGGRAKPTDHPDAGPGVEPTYDDPAAEPDGDED